MTKAKAAKTEVAPTPVPENSRANLMAQVEVLVRQIADRVVGEMIEEVVVKHGDLLTDITQRQKDATASIEQKRAQARAEYDKIHAVQNWVTKFRADTDVDGLKRNLHIMHRRLQMLIMRTTVATEIHYFAQKDNLRSNIIMLLMANVLEAFDWPDAWWSNRKETTIADWFDLMTIGFETQRNLVLEMARTGDEDFGSFDFVGDEVDD